MQPEHDINSLYQEAQKRWLRPAEVHFILQNHQRLQLTEKTPHKPASGSLFLFNKKVLKFFRKDGHDWRKKKDGRALAEGHERLKVGSSDALNCYYAHGEHKPKFQRRSYWMLDPAFEHIVLVHYRDISEGTHNGGLVMQFSPGSSAFTASSDSNAIWNRSFNPFVAESSKLPQSSYSPASVCVSAEKTFGINRVDRSAETIGSSDVKVRQALRMLEEELSLGDESFKETELVYSHNQTTDNLVLLDAEREIPVQTHLANLHSKSEITKLEESYGPFVRTLNSSSSLLLVKKDSGGSGDIGDEESEPWKDVLEKFETPLGLNSKVKERASSSSTLEVPNYMQEDTDWDYGPPTDLCSLLQLQELEYNNMVFEEDLIGVPLAEGEDSAVAQKQKFSIREISPEWAYVTEATKVLIVGCFLCDPTETTWTCMFGDTEVPLQIIQEGVLRCEVPLHHPGKVVFCITSGDQIPRSEIREFEYRDKTIASSEASKSPDELLLLVEFVQMLLFNSPCHANDSIWSRIMDTVREGSGTCDTVDWLLQELLKDKLQLWLSSKSQGGNQVECSLSKKEQGVIHLVAGLGYEWALNPIISHGIGVNFRDSKGWTALHWAARFGREKMVTALIASGASACTVTDPNSVDPIGKTPAFVAALNGHKGLAGYLAELDLTTHLSSLTLEETNISKDSAKVKAETTMISISEPNDLSNEDQVLLEQTLSAVRNAAQAAARIQAAFRALSFKKRQQREAAAAKALVKSMDEFGVQSADIQRLLTISNQALGSASYNSAALSIQKKYRGWKGRKDFLELRKRIVKIQAHVRGYQVRKHYKVICKSVRILDRLILRWRRKGAGLRGFRQDAESSDENEDEDFLKVFRKHKVDKAVDAEFSRVLSMVHCPEARQQYHRMLERYCQAKAGSVETCETRASDDDALLDFSFMDDFNAHLLEHSECANLTSDLAS